MGKNFHPAVNIPDFITAVRLVIVIAIARLLWDYGGAGGPVVGRLLLAAGVTDVLDGFLARRLGQVTLAGTLFDALTDQLLYFVCLVLFARAGLFFTAAEFMPWNPYPYLAVALAGNLALVAGTVVFIKRRRRRNLEFPAPSGTMKLNFWLWWLPLLLAVFRLGPGWLLAGAMYLTMASTLWTLGLYFRRAGYLFRP